jgi:hypothetical protein
MGGHSLTSEAEEASGSKAIEAAPVALGLTSGPGYPTRSTSSTRWATADSQAVGKGGGEETVSSILGVSARVKEQHGHVWMARLESDELISEPTRRRVLIVQEGRVSALDGHRREPHLGQASHLKGQTAIGTGLLRRVERNRYRLGLKLLTLSRTALDSFGVREHARPVMEHLAARLNATVHLATLDATEVVYVDKVTPAGGPAIALSGIGRRLPLHCTAVGKALLAQQSDTLRG